jgi:hypothetical protein
MNQRPYLTHLFSFISNWIISIINVTKVVATFPIFTVVVAFPNFNTNKNMKREKRAYWKLK